MKHQYFGDINDLFKYDLIHHVINGMDNIDTFTFIPMLTENDNKNDGNKIDFTKANGGYKNKELVAHLKRCLEDKRRNINEIKGYFAKMGIPIVIFEDSFNNNIRFDYFKKIIGKLTHNSLVFLDPDTGLEIKDSKEGHLLYDELKDIFRTIDENSVLMIIQFFPREDHITYLKRRTEEIKKITGRTPLNISDNAITFFFLTKNSESQKKLEEVISDYTNSYQKLMIENIE